MFRCGNVAERIGLILGLWDRPLGISDSTGREISGVCFRVPLATSCVPSGWMGLLIHSCGDEESWVVVGGCCAKIAGCGARNSP